MSYRDRAIALLVIGPIILFMARERIYNAVAGPFDIDAKALVAMQDVPQHRFVRVLRDGHALRFADLKAAAFHEETVQAVSGASHESATFRYLDEGDRRLLFRNADLADTGEAEVVGLVTSIPQGDQLQFEAGGAPLYLDCNKTGYRIGALLFLGAGLLAIGLALDQARRARKAASSAGT